MVATAERTHIIEFSDSEIRHILSSAVKQMVRVVNEPTSEQEITTLSKVIEKCSKISKSKSLTS